MGETGARVGEELVLLTYKRMVGWLAVRRGRRRRGFCQKQVVEENVDGKVISSVYRFGEKRPGQASGLPRWACSKVRGGGE
jgi:hypothetical protein